LPIPQEFEDIKGVSRICKLKKDRQHNCQKKKNKRTILTWRPSFALQTNERSTGWQNFLSTCDVHI